MRAALDRIMTIDTRAGVGIHKRACLVIGLNRLLPVGTALDRVVTIHAWAGGPADYRVRLYVVLNRLLPVRAALDWIMAINRNCVEFHRTVSLRDGKDLHGIVLVNQVS